MKIYGAGILDVVASRRFAGRGELQERLSASIAKFNGEFGAILPVPAGITLGDEWEFLTSVPAHSYELVEWFQDDLWPAGVELYVGIGLGGLSTGISTEIRQMDGPCFHLARQALLVAKGEAGTRRRYIFSKRNRVYLLTSNEIAAAREKENAADTENEIAVIAEGNGKDGAGPRFEDVINALIENTEIHKNRMTAKQRRLLLEYQRLGTYRRVAAANPVGRSPGGISQRLHSAEYFAVKRNGKLIASLLAAITYGEGGS